MPGRATGAIGTCCSTERWKKEADCTLLLLQWPGRPALHPRPRCRLTSSVYGLPIRFTPCSAKQGFPEVYLPLIHFALLG